MALHCSTATSAMRCLKPSSVQQLASATRRASACSSQRGRRHGAATASSDNGSYTGTGVSPPTKGHHFLHIDDFSRDQLGQPPLLRIGAPAACIQYLWGPQHVGGQPGQPRHSQQCPRLGRRAAAAVPPAARSCGVGTAARTQHPPPLQPLAPQQSLQTPMPNQGPGSQPMSAVACLPCPCPPCPLPVPRHPAAAAALQLRCWTQRWR